LSSLDPDDFTASERDAINARLAQETADLAQQDAGIARATAAAAIYDLLDNANQRVQDSVMGDILAILLQIITDRDTAEPSEAPHTIKFSNPPPGLGGSSWPVLTADMTVSGGLPVLLPYNVPFIGASVSNGDVATYAGGWQIFHINPSTTMEEIDPIQPTVGELGPTYSPLVVEFADQQEARLNVYRGSYILSTQQSVAAARDQSIRDMVVARNQVFKDIGFPTS